MEATTTHRGLCNFGRLDNLFTPDGWPHVSGVTADLTSRSLQADNRRGMLVVPAESEWIIQHDAADLTSRSLRFPQGNGLRFNRV